MSSSLLDYFFKPPLRLEKLFLLLQESGLKINEPNMSGLTPLMAAIMFGDKPTVELLLVNGATVNGELLAFAQESYPHKPEVIALLVSSLMKSRIQNSTPGSSDPNKSGPQGRRHNL